MSCSLDDFNISRADASGTGLPAHSVTGKDIISVVTFVDSILYITGHAVLTSDKI